MDEGNLSAEFDLAATMQQIDLQIDEMTKILRDEAGHLHMLFDRYHTNIARSRMHTKGPMLRKLDEAEVQLTDARQKAKRLIELHGMLVNIQKVNQMMVHGASDESAGWMLKFSAYIGAVSNICLGQLKYVMGEYRKTLTSIREQVMLLWMDRELSAKLRIILSINTSRLDQFLRLAHEVEITYADMSLLSSGGPETAGDLHERIMLRLVSNRLRSAEELNMIANLFPQWRYQ